MALICQDFNIFEKVAKKIEISNFFYKFVFEEMRKKVELRREKFEESQPSIFIGWLLRRLKLLGRDIQNYCWDTTFNE